MAYDNRTIVLLLLNIKKRSCGEKQSQGGTILAFSWRLIAFVLLSSSDVKIETIFFLVLSSSRTFFVHFQQKSNFCPCVICEQQSQYAQGKTFSFGVSNVCQIASGITTRQRWIVFTARCIQRISKIPKNVEVRMNSPNIFRSYFFCILILIIFTLFQKSNFCLKIQ